MHLRPLSFCLGLIASFAFAACAHADAPAANANAKSKSASSSKGEAALKPLYERFKASDSEENPSFGETPDFQKHISPLFGRLGCNGRACHGSFQGQGGFQLSLFGYDFEADYKALLEDESPRVDLEDKQESLILTKPVDADMHDGGQRYEHGSWEYWVLRSWVDAGAPFKSEKVHKLTKLEVTPKEILFSKEGQKQPLKVVAHWEDGTSEDVTCLCRFTTNDDAVAKIDGDGVVESGEAGDTHVVVSYDKAVVPIPTLRPISDRVGDKYPQIAGSTEIDGLVLGKLRKLGILPSEICEDEEFLRRASLDVTGTLPATSEIVEFVNNNRPDKRSRKIEELLSRPSYAAQWTTFLCDMTGNNEDQLRNFLPQRVDPSSHWYQWIYQRVGENVPYDEIVAGIVTANSRQPDESYREYCEEMSDICRDKSGKKFADRPGLVYYWARNNFRTPEDRAIGFAYSFLGVRIQCAQCHKHPFDQWSKNDFDNFEKLFANVQARQNTMSPDAKSEYKKMVADLSLDKKLKGNDLRRKFSDLLNEGEVVPMPELVVSKPRVPRTKVKGKTKQAQAPKAKLLGGEWLAMDEQDIRGDLMTWLRAEENPYFTRAIVNRIWKQYFGSGIVDPADDLNLANAPSNEPLLAYLSSGFRESGFDLKWVHRQILNSDTYQRSWQPNETNKHDKKNFSHSQLRRLSAESTYDALRMALANDDAVEQSRALEVPRAITKAGASARDRGRGDDSYALRVFGRSIRESNCDCDRSNEPSLLQTIFLLNDASVQKWLRDPKTSWVAQVSKKYGWELPNVSPANEARQKQLTNLLDRFIKQLEDADRRIEAAEKNGNRKLVKATKKRRDDMLKRARVTARKNGVENQLNEMLAGKSSEEVVAASVEMTDEQATWVANNAYLRTLSRTPNSQELDTVVGFLKSEEKPSVALEGLLWSLVNTKEFILNH